MISALSILMLMAKSIQSGHTYRIEIARGSAGITGGLRSTGSAGSGVGSTGIFATGRNIWIFLAWGRSSQWDLSTPFTGFADPKFRNTFQSDLESIIGTNLQIIQPGLL